MARVQFTFTFTNAQPGTLVEFNVPVYSSSSDATPDGPRLTLDASRAVSVWSDAANVTATSFDGRGEPISITATKSSPSATSGDGAAASNVVTAEDGLLTALPANGARANGSTFYATDDNGGRTWRMVAGVWVQAGPGVAEVGTVAVAGPVYLSSSFDVKAVGVTITDVSGMSLAPTTNASRIIRLRAKLDMICNMGTSTSGSVNGALVYITDSTGSTTYAEEAATVVSTGATAGQFKSLVIEYDIPAGTTGQTYKLRARLQQGAQANMTSCALSPAFGGVAGAKNAFTAQVL